MSKILKNTTISSIFIDDVGISIPSSSQIVVETVDELLWSGSSDLVIHVGTGDIIINDGTKDLNKSEGLKLIQGIYPSEIILQDNNGVALATKDNSLVSSIDKESILDIISTLNKINDNMSRLVLHLSIVTDEEL